MHFSSVGLVELIQQMKSANCPDKKTTTKNVHHLLIKKGEIDRHGHFYGFVIVLDKILDHLKNIIMGTSNKKVGCSM